MRPIKFRCYNARTVSYTYGVFPTAEKLKLSYLYYEQFTGLLDKNGVEIYEGDILLIIDFSDPEMRTFMAKVEFIKAHYSLKIIKGSVDFSRIGLSAFDSGEEDIEVIGNINQNKELLKGDKDD